MTVARPSLDDVYLRHTGHRYASDGVTDGVTDGATSLAAEEAQS